MQLYTNAALCYTNALAQASKHQTDMVRGKFSCVLQKLRPWNMITAKHESCLCKSCENFGCYEKGLAKALELLLDAYKGSEPADDDEGVPLPLHPIPLLLILYLQVSLMTQSSLIQDSKSYSNSMILNGAMKRCTMHSLVTACIYIPWSPSDPRNAAAACG